jgi:hypothetical protein
VRSASGDDGRKIFQLVGHRGPVYKGLGAMNPCDHLHLREYRIEFCNVGGARGGVVVKALRYKPAGRGFDWNFSVT